MTFVRAIVITLLLAILAVLGGAVAFVFIDKAAPEDALLWTVTAIATHRIGPDTPLSAAGQNVAATLFIVGPVIAGFFALALGMAVRRCLIERRRQARLTMLPLRTSANGRLDAYDPSERLSGKGLCLTDHTTPNPHLFARSDGGVLTEVENEVNPLVATVTTRKKAPQAAEAAQASTPPAADTTPQENAPDDGREKPRVVPMSTIPLTKDPVSGNAILKQPQADPEPPRKPAGSHKVVIVDDDPIILKIYSSLFQKAGIKPLVASNGVDAFQLILTERPDVAVIDYMLPLLSGIQITEKLKHEDALKDMHVVLFTSDEQAQTRDHALEAGADAIVTKVDNPQVLLDTVIEILHG